MKNLHISIQDVCAAVLIFFFSLFLVFDLFFISGQSATFDGPMHITVTAQFFKAISQGEMRVTWADGFGNYGMPIPLIHHQVAAYLSAWINFIFHNVLLSTNIVWFLGAFLSSLFFYIFLRFYFSWESSLAATFFFNFTSYRILNIYLRGDLPEFFASVFIPLILISLYVLIVKKKLLGFALLTISVALLFLSHPFVSIIGAFLFVPYGSFLLWQSKEKVKYIILITLSVLLGIGLTAYYALPLISEIKYFYYGTSKNHLAPNQYLGLLNYFYPQWYYFGKDSPLVRGNYIILGLPEVLALGFGLGLTIYSFLKKRFKENSLIIVSTLSAALFIFLTTQYANFLYTHINILSSIQHPWRMLGGLIFIPPIIVAFVISKSRYKVISTLIIIILIAFIRFPQLYGKNFMLRPQSDYFFTTENLAAVVLNPIWTGKSEDYPIEKQKPHIISGTGSIIKQTVKNSSREYIVNAQTPLRMVDYTFYFPGWTVYVDHQPVPIEFQDPSFRGVITYNVPSGKHTISLKFENTKVRNIGNLISLLSIGGFLLAVAFLYKRKFIH